MDQFGAIQSNFVALEKSQISPCPIGREGQPICLFKNEIAKLSKIINTLLSQSPDTRRLKEIHSNIRSLCIAPHKSLNSLLQSIEDCIEQEPSRYPTLVKDLDFIKQTIVTTQKIRTNISIGEWLDTEIISAILRQFQYNKEQAGLTPYRFGGCFRYDDFEVYDDKSINCGCLSPSPDIDHLKWNYIKQAPFTHFIFNTCSRISTGQHFVSLTIQIMSNEIAHQDNKVDHIDSKVGRVQLQYFDSQHSGPYHNGETPPDFHTRNFGNPLCNRFKNYTSHFDDWFDHLTKEAKADGFDVDLIYNKKTYQTNNYACGIYSIYHGICQCVDPFDKVIFPSTDNAMDKFMDKLVNMGNKVAH